MEVEDSIACQHQKTLAVREAAKAAIDVSATCRFHRWEDVFAHPVRTKENRTGMLDDFPDNGSLLTNEEVKSMLGGQFDDFALDQIRRDGYGAHQRIQGSRVSSVR